MSVPKWFRPHKMATMPTDKSAGFTDRKFPLYVPGAETTIEPGQILLERVDPIVMAHIAQADTHFKAEYPFSSESRTFPEHQIFGSEEWGYMLNMNSLKADVVWIFKNVFDMGGSVGDSGVDPAKVRPLITDPLELRFFDNLFNVGRGDPDDPASMVFAEHRDVYFERLLQDGLRVTLHMGDATDYCVRDALKYALKWKRIEHAVLLTDLTHGIYNVEIPGGVGSLDELIRTDAVLWEAFQAGRLVLVKSDEFLRHVA